MLRAFAEARQRNSWLERGTLKVRTSSKDKTIRCDFRDGSFRGGGLDPRDRNKTVTVQHEKLYDAGAVEEKRALWKEHLVRLGRVLKS